MSPMFSDQIKSKILSVFVLILFLLAAACSSTSGLRHKPHTEREVLFDEAESLYEDGRFNEAFPLYLRLSRSTEGSFDPVYDESLWRLTSLYEKNDAPEKALLCLAELTERPGASVSEYRIRFAQARNYFRVDNRLEAFKALSAVNEDFDRGYLTVDDLVGYLPEATEFVYDRHMPAELMYLGKIQKYFVYVMESEHPESDRIGEHLTSVYNRFFAALDSPALSAEFKRHLSILLYDQLRHFDIYQLDGYSENAEAIRKFSAYSSEKQKTLAESFLK